MQAVRYVGTSDVRRVTFKGKTYSWSAENDFVESIPEALVSILDEDGGFVQEAQE